MSKEQIPFVQHTAGPYTAGLQYCVVCGCVLTDYRNAVSCDGTVPNGWPEGHVYVSGNFYTTQLIESEPRTTCKP